MTDKSYEIVADEEEEIGREKPPRRWERSKTASVESLIAALKDRNRESYAPR